MIRLLHTSDWHLGRMLYGKSLIEDQSFALDGLLDLIGRVKPHALLIAGDIFDRTIPPEAAVSLLDRFLTEATGRRGLPIFIIPGNHDSCERLGFASGFLRERGVTIFSRVEDSFRPVRVEGDQGVAALIHGIPFVEPVVIARALGRSDIETPDLAIGALCREILEKKKGKDAAVLLCHAFVTGGETSESEKDIFIGGSSQVDARAFSGFAYTALGHLHKSQSAGASHIRYSGSLLPYSKSEIAHEKSILEVQINADGAVEIQPHHLPIKRKLRLIEGELETLLIRAKDDASREDYVIASYTDRGAVLDAFSKLHLHYPNLLHVSRAAAFMPGEVPALARSRERENVSELDLFAEFFRSATGGDLTEPEREALIESINEVNLSAGAP